MCDALKEECGVFGVYNFDGHTDAANIIYMGFTPFSIEGRNPAELQLMTVKRLYIIRIWGLCRKFSTISC